MITLQTRPMRSHLSVHNMQCDIVSANQANVKLKILDQWDFAVGGTKKHNAAQILQFGRSNL